MTNVAIEIKYLNSLGRANFKLLMMKNKKKFTISVTLAVFIKKQNLDIKIDTKYGKKFLLTDPSTCSKMNIIKTNSLTHFYISILNKKFRINKNLYIYLSDNRKQQLKLIDLCAGTGGAMLVAQKNSFLPVYSNDNCSNSKEIVLGNFTTLFDPTSLHKININNIPDHDVLVAGFPCQPFSIAGEKRGLKDPRSDVF